MPGKSIDDKTLWRIDTPKSFEHDPFGNRWENHPAAVENQLKEEEQPRYGKTSTEILKTEYPHIYSGYMAIVEE